MGHPLQRRTWRNLLFVQKPACGRSSRRERKQAALGPPV